jgi:hypothetical protein
MLPSPLAPAAVNKPLNWPRLWALFGLMVGMAYLAQIILYLNVQVAGSVGLIQPHGIIWGADFSVLLERRQAGLKRTRGRCL